MSKCLVEESECFSMCYVNSRYVVSKESVSRLIRDNNSAKEI